MDVMFKQHAGTQAMAQLEYLPMMECDRDPVKICYLYAYLSSRRKAGLTLCQADRQQLAELESVLEGDAIGRKRRHRRIAVLARATLRTPVGLRYGTILNMGGGGMFVATKALLPSGTTIQVRLGDPEDVEYSFSCKVQWVCMNINCYGMGLRLVGIPLEIRHGPHLRACA